MSKFSLEGKTADTKPVEATQPKLGGLAASRYATASPQPPKASTSELKGKSAESSEGSLQPLRGNQAEQAKEAEMSKELTPIQTGLKARLCSSISATDPERHQKTMKVLETVRRFELASRATLKDKEHKFLWGLAAASFREKNQTAFNPKNSQSQTEHAKILESFYESFLKIKGVASLFPPSMHIDRDTSDFSRESPVNASARLDRDYDYLLKKLDNYLLPTEAKIRDFVNWEQQCKASHQQSPFSSMSPQFMQPNFANQSQALAQGIPNIQPQSDWSQYQTVMYPGQPGMMVYDPTVWGVDYTGQGTFHSNLNNFFSDMSGSAMPYRPTTGQEWFGDNSQQFQTMSPAQNAFNGSQGWSNLPHENFELDEAGHRRA